MNSTFNFDRTLRVWVPAIVALALSLPLLSAGSLAQETSSALQAVAARQETTPMRIVVVEWRIKKGREQEFLEYWSKQATIADRSGLISEFLSRVESQQDFPWMVWDLNPAWTTFLNVGYWREGADFQQQIGRFIDNSKPPLAFEAERRRRVFLAPERWRVGAASMLKTDHPGVR